jgi:hypothetical protein
MRKKQFRKEKAAGSGARGRLDERAEKSLVRWQKPLLAVLCLAAALRVFAFSAAFPFFNNVDEQAHVDVVLKYARGHWPRATNERFDAEAARLILLYGTPEYLDDPKQRGIDVPPPPWQMPAFANYVLERGTTIWTGRVNHEANSPPVYYALAGTWYTAGRALGLRDGQLLYWLRFLNVPLIVLLVCCGYALSRELHPDRIDLRIGVPALLAFLPQDVFYSINSDVLSPVLFAFSLLLVLRWYRREAPGVFLSASVGLLVALTFLVKYTNIALPLIFGVVVLLKARKKAWVPVAIAVVAAALPVAICLGRNYLLLGDLAGTQAKVEFLGWSRRPFNAIFAHPILTPAGFWTFWSGLMHTFWRGEFVWHLKRIASPVADTFYSISSLALLIAAAVSAVRRRWQGRAADEAVWASVILSVLCLAVLSVWFQYGNSFYPSQKEPYFTSGRLIAGMLVPFLILYLEGVAFLLRPFSRVAGPLAFVLLTCVMMTVSEVTLSRDMFTNAYNWFYLP